MEKKTRGEQTREEIIQAAARLFSLHGFFATGLMEILEGASISKGAFYHHFKSKEDLAIAVLDTLRADYEQQVFAPVRQVADPAERFSFMFTRLVELNESGQWKNCLLLVRLSLEMAQSVGELSERIGEMVETLIRFWGERIREARTAGSIRDDVDPVSLAALIHCTWLGAIACREMEIPSCHLAEIAENLHGLILRT